MSTRAQILKVSEQRLNAAKKRAKKLAVPKVERRPSSGPKATTRRTVRAPRKMTAPRAPAA